MTQKTNSPWTFDVRVRERNLKAGSLTEKELEKYLSTLPDLSDQSESFGTSQPALSQPSVVASPVVAVATPSVGASESDVDDLDDEDEDEDDELDAAEGNAGSAPAEVAAPERVIADEPSVAGVEAAPEDAPAGEPEPAPETPAEDDGNSGVA